MSDLIEHIPLQIAALLPDDAPPLPTPFPQLNHLLHGGLPSATISELFAPKSSFKTQFVISLAAHTALAGRVAILFDADAAIHHARLAQVILTGAASPHHAHSSLENILIYPVLHWNHLILLTHLLPALFAKHAPAFVAIDSISSLFRTSNQSMPTKRLEAVAAYIRQAAATYNVSVLFTNSARLNHQHSLTAALGDAWRHVIGTRLALQRHRNANHASLRIVKSVFPTRPAPITVYVTDAGLVQSDSSNSTQT